MNYPEFNNVLRAVAKMVCHSQIEQKELLKYFKFILVHTARSEFPDDSIAQLSHKVGISRGTVADMLDETEPTRTINKDSIILSELWRIKDADNKVTISGNKNSFYSIAKPLLNGSYAPQSCLDALVAAKSVEYCDEHTKLLIHTKKLESSQVSKDMMYYIGYVLENLVETNLYNRNELNVDKFFDLTYRSTKTPVKNIKKTHTQIKKLLNENIWPSIKQIIDSNEVDVPAGTYPEYSITIFEHKNKEGK